MQKFRVFINIGSAIGLFKICNIAIGTCIYIGIITEIPI